MSGFCIDFWYSNFKPRYSYCFFILVFLIVDIPIISLKKPNYPALCKYPKHRKQDDHTVSGNDVSISEAPLLRLLPRFKEITPEFLVDFQNFQQNSGLPLKFLIVAYIVVIIISVRTFVLQRRNKGRLPNSKHLRKFNTRGFHGVTTKPDSKFLPKRKECFMRSYSYSKRGYVVFD